MPSTHPCPNQKVKKNLPIKIDNRYSQHKWLRQWSLTFHRLTAEHAIILIQHCMIPERAWTKKLIFEVMDAIKKRIKLPKGIYYPTAMSKKKELHISKHHIIPSSRKGATESSNLVALDTQWHQEWHRLFGNMTPDEAIYFIKKHTPLINEFQHNRIHKDSLDDRNRSRRYLNWQRPQLRSHAA